MLPLVGHNGYLGGSALQTQVKKQTEKKKLYFKPKSVCNKGGKAPCAGEGQRKGGATINPPDKQVELHPKSYVHMFAVAYSLAGHQ